MIRPLAPVTIRLHTHLFHLVQGMILGSCCKPTEVTQTGRIQRRGSWLIYSRRCCHSLPAQQLCLRTSRRCCCSYVEAVTSSLIHLNRKYLALIVESTTIPDHPYSSHPVCYCFSMKIFGSSVCNTLKQTFVACALSSTHRFLFLFLCGAGIVRKCRTPFCQRATLHCRPYETTRRWLCMH